MSKVTIYHNPRCSKSRQTLELLKERCLEINIVEYLDHPPSTETLDELCTGLSREPLELIRTKESLFSELGLSKKDSRPRKEWLKIMHENPKLIERPIVVNDAKAALGRPPEDVLKIL